MAAPTLPCRKSSLTPTGPVEELVSLSVSHIEVQRGELLWEDKKVPFEFDARDMALLLNYSLLRRRYEAHVVAGGIEPRICSSIRRLSGGSTPR